MMTTMNAVARTRELLFELFRWTGGHADLSLVFRDAEFIRLVGPSLSAAFHESDVDAVVGIEARGFVLGALAAEALGVGLVLARKPGAVHPGAERETATEPDWRGRNPELAIARAAVSPGERLLLVDDWMETGSQARTVGRILGRFDAELIGVSVLVDETSSTQTGPPITSLARASELEVR